MEPKEFGEYLKSLRIEEGLTMRKLDSLSGVSHSYISQLERGERGVPSPEVLKKLADALNVNYPPLLEKAGYLDLAKLAERSEIELAFGDMGLDELRRIDENNRFVEGLTDLKTFLNRGVSPHPKYNGHQLTDQDKQLILRLLKAVFPHYDKGE